MRVEKTPTLWVRVSRPLSRWVIVLTRSNSRIAHVQPWWGVDLGGNELTGSGSSKQKVELAEEEGSGIIRIEEKDSGLLDE